MNDKSYSHFTDSQLLHEFRCGDSHAFEALIQRYRKPLFSYLYRMTGNYDTAEDIFQDTFLKLLNNLSKYTEQGKFGNWLFGIAHNLIVDHARKNNKFRSTSLEDESIGFSEIEMNSNSDMPDVLTEAKEINEIILEGVLKLSFEQRQVFVLREHSEMPFREIAEMLDRPLNTVLAQMRYALINLRKYLEENYKGEISHVM